MNSMFNQRPHSVGPMRRGFEKEQVMEGRKGRKKDDGNRILITVTVPGSAGLIRFVVRETELVEAVIGTVLKCYAKEGRLPVFGSDCSVFALYCAYDGSDALSPCEPIGSNRSRNFLLCRKQVTLGKETPAAQIGEVGKKGKAGWRAWLNKSLSFRVSPR